MSKLIANSLLDEVQRLHEHQSSGTLVLTAADGQRIEIYFREGMIEGASSNLGGRRLGDYVIKAGGATVRDLEPLQATAQRQKILFGESVFRKGLLSYGEIGTAVRCQVIDLLVHAFQHEFEIDSFQSNLRSYYAPARITFRQVLLELCRNNAPGFKAGTDVRIAISDDVDLSAFQWYPQELYVLSELQYPGTFERLLKTTGLQEMSLRKILGVLVELGVIEVGESSAAVDAVQEAVLVRSAEFPFEHLIPVVTNAALSDKLEVAKNEFSFTSEQFKNLKVLITENNSTSSLKVLTVSSPDAQDGKSLIAANLGFSFAMDPGRRIIVVDCDLRSPSLGEYLGVPSEPGLLQYLANGHLSPYCYVRRIQNLYFLTAGGVAPNPVEILSMQKMKHLVEQLRKDFDTVILDAPPYCPIADARIVTGLSDGLIMVVRRGKTTYSSSDRAFKAVDRNKLLGVVFNDVQPMLFHTYYNFGYYHYGRNKRVYPGNSKISNTPKNYLES